MKIFSLIPSLLVLAAVTAGAAESHVLAKKDHVPPAGTKIQLTKKTDLSNGTLKITLQGKNMDGTCKLSESEAQTLTFAGDKFNYLLTSSVKNRVMALDGKEMPEKQAPSPLLNVPVVATKKDGKWTAAREDATEPTEEQKTELEKIGKNANQEQELAMYGTGPRAIGDTWTVDAKDLPFTQDDKNTTGSMKFTFKGVEEYEGRKCARLEGVMELSGNTDEDKGGQKILLKGNVVVLRSLEDLCDLKMEMTGKMEMAGDIPNGTMTMGGDMKIEQIAKISK